MRRAAAVLVAFAAPVRTRGRVCRTISTPIPSTSSTRDFHAARPTFTFSVTDFASLRRGNTATATFVGTFQRGNGAGASCRGRASRASTPATSVRGRIDQEIAARQFCATSMAEPSRVPMRSRLPERSKKCSRPCATGASYWPSGWRAERQDDDGSRRTASPHTTGLLVRSPSIAGERVHLSRTQNNCKCLQIWFSFGKNTSFECSKPSIQPTPR
jgi:hypothetical protein